MFILCFFILHLMTNNMYMVSLFHAIVTSTISLFYIPTVFSDQVEDENTWGKLCAHFTLHFMLYDLIMNVRTKEYLLHHVLAICASSYILYLKKFETLVLFIELNECSTIFLNLIQLNVYKKINYFFFSLTFFLTRNVWLSWLLFTYTISDIYLYLFLHLHYILQAFWLIKICAKIIRK